MPEPESPEWVRLARRLIALTSETAADNAYVLDAWANLWCAGHSYEGGESGLVMDLVEKELSSLQPALNRGGRIERAFERTFIKSFAGVYVVALRFPGPFDTSTVRDAVTRALPAIEVLTLALPPPHGPGSGSSEGFGVA